MLIKDASVWYNSRMKVAGGVASEIYQKIGGVWRKDISNNDRNWFDVEVGTPGVYGHVLYNEVTQLFCVINSNLEVFYSKDGSEWQNDYEYLIGVGHQMGDAHQLYTYPGESWFYGHPVAVDTTSRIIGVAPRDINGEVAIAYIDGTYASGTVNGDPSTGTTVVLYPSEHWKYGHDSLVGSQRETYTYYIEDRLLGAHVFIVGQHLVVIPNRMEETTDYYYTDMYADGYVMTKGELPIAGAWLAAAALVNGTIGVAKSNSNVFLHIDGNNPSNVTITELPRVSDWSCMASQGNQFMLLASDSDLGLRTSATGNILEWDTITSITNADWHSMAPYNGGYVAITRHTNVTQVTTDGLPWRPVYQQRDGTWGNVAALPNGPLAIAGNVDRATTIATLNWDDPDNTQPFVLFDINMNTIGEHGIQQIHTCTFGTDDIYVLVFRDLIPGYGREVGTYFTVHKAVPGIVTLDNLGEPLYTGSEIFSTGGHDYNLIDSLKVFDASCFRGDDGLPENKIVISFSDYYDRDSAPVLFNADRDIVLIRNEDDTFYTQWAGDIESMPALPSWIPREGSVPSGSSQITYGYSVTNLSSRDEIQPSVVMQFIPSSAEILRKNVMTIEEFHPY